MARLGMIEPSRAVTALPFDVKSFGQRGNFGRVATQLTGSTQDDFWLAVIVLNVALNFYSLSNQLPDVTHVRQITAKDHQLEGTHAIVFTKIKKSCALIGVADVYHFPGHATGRTDMLISFFEWDALSCRRGHDQQNHANRFRASTQPPKSAYYLK